MSNASTAAENQALAGLTGGATNLMAYLQLHTAAPGTTGANEMASTTRQAMTWNAPSGGSMTNSGTASFTTPGTTAATNWGTFSAVSSGTYGVGGALTASVTAVTITVAAGAITESAS